MFNKEIVIGGILTAIGLLFIATSYHPAFDGALGYTGAYLKPGPLGVGIFILIFGGIVLANGIKKYSRQ